MLLSPRIVAPPLVQELRTRDDRLDEAAERIPVGYKPSPHFVEGFLVRQQQAAAQRVRVQLATQIVEEVILPPVAQILAQARQLLAILAVGKYCARFDRLAT